METQGEKASLRVIANPTTTGTPWKGRKVILLVPSLQEVEIHTDFLMFDVIRVFYLVFPIVLLYVLCLCGGACGSDAETALYTELWHACAGPLVTVPRERERVFYFPQGHIEQV